jgi:hypothetical protein
VSLVDRMCWGRWSITRPKLVRCDAHWHRPKRADWRAKAYERAARWRCVKAAGMLLDGPFCSLRLAGLHPARALAHTGTCRGRDDSTAKQIETGLDSTPGRGGPG